MLVFQLQLIAVHLLCYTGGNSSLGGIDFFKYVFGAKRFIVLVNCLQIDPELSRTVIVSTKLDTKIPQFARASDVEVFLSPPASTLHGLMLGDSPFFTSVPSGRVGPGHESVYRSNDEFKQVFHYTVLALSRKSIVS